MSHTSELLHPSDETLARFVGGDVDARTRNDVLVHLDHCAECMVAVLATNEHLHEEEELAEPPQRNSRWWMAAVAAAVLLLLVAVPVVRRQRDPMRQLVAVSPASARTVEPRLSGGFAWAPYHGPERSTGAGASPERLKVDGAAGTAIERARRDDSEAAQHAAGVAMILVEKPDDAATRLEALAQRNNDAKTWSDVAAARYAAVMKLGQPAQLPQALAAADTALRIDPNLPEALFNRALILERMGQSSEARKAWTRYLEVDGGSPWATEARQHLEDLSGR